MRRVGSHLFAGALALLAAPVRAVDIAGSWSVCLSGPGALCPTTIVGSLTSSAGQFRLDLSSSGTPCVVVGSVDAGTGALSVTDASGCPVYFNGMSATATDTAISGSFSLLLCPTYTIGGVKSCGTCDDGNACTVDGCGATACSAPSSSCTIAPLSGVSCDDGLACTTGDTCVAGTCAGTPTTCNDGNPCTSDACDPGTGACVFTPNSDACDDGDPCTTGDTCSGGTCAGGPPLQCGPCETCRPIGGCVVGPVSGCRHSINPRRSRLELKDAPNDANDRVVWTWGAGEATSTADLGDPVGADDYTLCVFDGGIVSPRLMLQSTAPSGGTCAGGTSCWKARGAPAGSKGFVYKDSGILLPDGLKAAKLVPGAAGRATAKVRGAGAMLDLPSPMSVTLPVTVQFRGQRGQCLESTFTAARVSREDLFRASASQ